MALSKLFLIVAVIALSTAAGCGMPHLLYGKRVAGQVVDAETGEPIAGAHVALLWRSVIIPTGFTGHNSRDICFHAAATTTDAQGHFDIPGWWKWKTYNVSNVDPTVLVYAPRYVPLQHPIAPEQPNPTPIEHSSEHYRLKKFTGSSKARLDMLFFGLANQGCDYGGDSQKSLYPMLKHIYVEARNVAVPKELYGFALMAAYAAIAPDPNGPGQDDKLNSFIKEHLQ